MSDNDVQRLHDAVLVILREAISITDATRRILALPEPSSVRGGVGGMVTDELPNARSGRSFDIIGDVTVRFNDDGTRRAMFAITTKHDDPNPRLVDVHWAQGFLTQAEVAAAHKVLFG